jgi:hypothetical protein
MIDMFLDKSWRWVHPVAMLASKSGEYRW